MADTEADAFDILEEAVQIPSPHGTLEGILAHPFVGVPGRSALVVGPHPLMGGRLENNVVRHVGRGLAEHGFATLRFRFAGAGATSDVMDRFWKTGRAPEDPQRASEASAAHAWLTTLCGEATILVGYSFGASLLADLVTPRTRGVVLIGATLAQHDYAALADRPIPKLLIAADNDFATPLPTTEAWFANVADPKQLVVMPSAEHFYRGQEGRIVEEIMQWLPI